MSFKVDSYFHFSMVNAENTISRKYTEQKWHKCVWGYFRNFWIVCPNLKPKFIFMKFVCVCETQVSNSNDNF